MRPASMTRLLPAALPALALAALCTCLACAAPALAADQAFAGDDAAYVDWAWKNCAMVSTAKLRGLVDQARAKSNDAFQLKYEQQYRKIVDANPAPAETKRTCEQVAGWYGTIGSRITELVDAKSSKPTAAGKSIGSKASTDLENSGRRGGGGGGGKRGGN